MSNDKMREEFETFWLAPEQAELRASCAQGWAFEVWHASRAALVIKLPGKISQYNTDDAGFVDPAAAEHDEAIDDCQAAIEAAGVRVKS